MKPSHALTPAVLALAIAGCAGAPGTTAGVPAMAKIAYDFAAAHAARLSGGKVALPPFDASQIQTTNLPFTFANGRITMNPGIAASIVRLDPSGTAAQVFANGAWFAAPVTPAAAPAAFELLAFTLPKVRPAGADDGAAKFVYLARVDGYAVKQAGGPSLMFQLIQAASKDSMGWQVAGSDGPDDMVVLAGGNGELAGGGGNDKLANQGEGSVALVGGTGDDKLEGGGGVDFIDGGQGNDELAGGAGDDYLEGGQGDDKQAGGDGNDFLDGGDGADTLDSGAGNDDLYGGGGEDQLIDGAGEDDVYQGEYVDADNDGVDDVTTDDAPEADDEAVADTDASGEVGGDADTVPAAGEGDAGELDGADGDAAGDEPTP